MLASSPFNFVVVFEYKSWQGDKLERREFFECCRFDFGYTESLKYTHKNRRRWNLSVCFLFQTRNRFEGTRSEVEELMNKIRQNPKDHKRASQFTAEGYLYVQEKSKTCPKQAEWLVKVCGTVCALCLQESFP